MPKGQKELFISSGSLNALVIHSSGEGKKLDGLCSVVAAMVETPGNEPGPAERRLKTEQEIDVRVTAVKSVPAWNEACKENDGAATFSVTRCGDAGQSVRLQLTCSLGEQCCQMGLEASEAFIKEQITAAQDSVRIAPLLPFQFPKPQQT